jgi:multiple antibiotic resistance protein
MLFPSAITDKEAMAKEAGIKYDIAFTPLAMPGLSGPGTFAVVMSLSSQAAARAGWNRIADFAGVLTAIFVTAMLSWKSARRGAREPVARGDRHGSPSLTGFSWFASVCSFSSTVSP